MEPSAPKRRKTSPSTAVPVANAVKNNANADLTTPPEPPRAVRRRPSFASPTRASLARHNPDVLARKKQPAARPRPAAKPADYGASEPVADDGDDAEVEAQTKQDDSNTRNGRQNPGQTGQGLSARPRRSPVRLPPRPLPPPGPEDEEPLNPFVGRGLRRSWPTKGPEPEPQPELPPTPEKPKPVTNTPPSGIHSTSRRPRRSRALAERIQSASPGNMRDSQWKTGQPPSKEAVPSKLQFGGEFHGGDVDDVAEVELDEREQRALRRAMRGIEVLGVDSEQQKQRHELLAEIAQLTGDLELLTRENQRLRDDESATDPGDFTVLDALRRNLLPTDGDEAQGGGDAQWLEMALNPIGFLPFSKAGLDQIPSLFTPDATADDEALPTSHHPIQMTAAEELPFLQVFTPLAFASQTELLPRESPTDQLLRRHTIFVSSTAPRGVFSAQLAMTVDATAHRILELSVPRLDPAAAAELDPVVDRYTKVDGGRAARNNVTVLAWAMGEWVRVATRRARFWHVLEGEMSEKEGLMAAAARARARKRADEDDDEGRDGAADAVSRRELLPHMGRTAMEIEVPVRGADDKLQLRVQWRIRFDWTGEAESEVELLAGVPGKWRKADDRGKLYEIPGVFRKLVEEDGDPVAAVRSVVALLVGDES